MKKHTEDFKQEAVRIALSSGMSRRRIAADLGVGLSTLGKWVSVYRPTDTVSAPQADLARENERLRLENRILKEERDILKNGPRTMGSSSRAKSREVCARGNLAWIAGGTDGQWTCFAASCGCRRVDIAKHWKLGRARPISNRARADVRVLAHIREQYRLSLGSYGRPRMTPKGDLGR